MLLLTTHQTRTLAPHLKRRPTEDARPKTPDRRRLTFRRDAGATPPSWPRPENSLQAHLDFLVEDLDETERRVVEPGGRPLRTREAPGPYEERSCADPAGHSFTLRLVPPTAPKQG